MVLRLGEMWKRDFVKGKNLSDDPHPPPFPRLCPHARRTLYAPTLNTCPTTTRDYSIARSTGSDCAHENISIPFSPLTAFLNKAEAPRQDHPQARRMRFRHRKRSPEQAVEEHREAISVRSKPVGS